MNPTRIGWERVASRRRILLFVLIVVPTIAATEAMYSLLPARAGLVTNSLLVILFAMLFAWVAIGFWSAVAGIVMSLRRFDRFSPMPEPDRPLSLPKPIRTAILFPVYNEDPRRVTEAIRVVWKSLKKLGAQDNFNIFMLSDSTNPDSYQFHLMIFEGS